MKKIKNTEYVELINLLKDLHYSTNETTTIYFGLSMSLSDDTFIDRLKDNKYYNVSELTTQNLIDLNLIEIKENEIKLKVE